ncbi:PilZ domain-containing protein [Sphingomonas sp.]|uniref:PilZ domain-containing protein n=1 Tax=Sphingomonas sp. TaxID=28214 RepID=UPI003B00E7A2
MTAFAMQAELQIEAVEEQRAAERYDTVLPGGVRRSGSSRVAGTVRDLSRSGFRIDAQERLPQGSVVWLKIGHLEPLMAEVVWSEGLSAGCRFAATLHPSVLETVLASAR